MNRTAFQIYGSKKTGIFQSTWDTTLVGALGGELAGVAASGSGWSSTTNLNTIESTHTPGFTSNLVTSRAATAMQTYQIVCTVTGTTGTIQVRFGNNTSAAISPGTTTITLMALNTNQLTIIPSSDFDGNVKLSVKTSSSASNQVKLPLPNSGTYNIWVDWGDGTYDNITSYNSIKTLHTYPAPGIYTVRITGDRFSWQFANLVDRLKIKTVSSWGKLKIGGQSFYGCSNVTMSGITDVPDLTGVTSLQAAFQGCSKITTVGRMNEWNTSSVTNMVGTFNGSVLFNQCIGDWNTSNVTIMSGMFNSCTVFNNGFAAGVGTGNQLNWDTSSCITMDGMFTSAPAFNSNLGTGTTPWDVSKVTTFLSMFQSASNFNNGDDSAPINNWNINTVSNVSMASMFFLSSVFNRSISSWNVSNVTTFASMFHTAIAFNNGFASEVENQLPWTLNTTSNIDMSRMFANTSAFNSNLGTGTTPWNVSKVTTFGSMFNGASKFNNGDETTLSKMNDWSINTVSNVDMGAMFAGAYKFNREVSSWNVSKVTTFAAMFSTASIFNNGDNLNTNPITGLQGINGWNINTVSNVVMNSMFQSAIVFDRPIESWNMTKVINTSQMFNNASIFNQPLSNWERVGSTMGNNTSTSYMFLDAIAFDQPIGSWNVSSVTSMYGMFNNARAFNQPIGSWNVSEVTTMGGMFSRAIAFNQPLDNWERVGSTTGKVTDMASMFANASIFNGLVDTWNVSGVTNMIAMFYNAPRFNQPLANWERAGSTLANVTAFTSANIYVGMFGLATDFNQPIGNWNVSKVTRMNYMFRNATNFNQSIDAWDVSSVWDMEGMFNNATSFNKPLGSWNLSKISNMVSMFEGANAFNNGLAAGLSGTFTWNINTISDINMSRMFANLGVFNQNIGAWNVSRVTNFTNFMLGKTPSTFSSTNLDAIYNGWSALPSLKPNLSISFGTAKYSQAGKPGKDTLLASPNNWTITDGLLNVSGTSNNGGLIRVTTSSLHQFTTGNSVYIYGVNGTTNANGTWTVTVVSSTVIELQGSTYNAAWTSGGNVILG